ncbi:MAG: cryptochrome/photolyase family protein [Candidatus Babeliales bacterium]
MKSITLIFPHQLFTDHPALAADRPVYLVELAYFFTRYKFHKHKLILHRASMQDYAQSLQRQGYNVTYFEYNDAPTITSLINKLSKNNIRELHYTELIETELIDELLITASKQDLELFAYESPYFMSDRKLLEEFFKPQKKQYLMASFYRKQRISLDILVTKAGKPIGGSWSYDALNRERLKNNVAAPRVPRITKTEFVKNAITWVDLKFADNPGKSATFLYPTNHKQAQAWLKNFIEKRFALFGPYQDAIDKENSVLFHSVLTPILNIGLLTPRHIIDTALAYTYKHKVPLQSTEGFIRQIIGWREYMYGMYLFHGKKQKKSNFFKHTRSIPKSFWNGATGIMPLDQTIQKVVADSYAHHIERLMVLGNFMLLCQFNPQQVYDWFMELFVDAYDWVMTPNVFGMSQYADGGLIATKPYICGSNYILKMSNYQKGAWCKQWDALFWHFIDTNIKTFSSNSRCAFMVRSLERMNTKKRQEHTACARRFLKLITKQ